MGPVPDEVILGVSEGVNEAVPVGVTLEDAEAVSDMLTDEDPLQLVAGLAVEFIEPLSDTIPESLAKGEGVI